MADDYDSLLTAVPPEQDEGEGDAYSAMLGGKYDPNAVARQLQNQSILGALISSTGNKAVEPTGQMLSGDAQDQLQGLAKTRQALAQMQATQAYRQAALQNQNEYRQDMLSQRQQDEQDRQQDRVLQLTLEKMREQQQAGMSGPPDPATVDYYAKIYNQSGKMPSLGMGAAGMPWRTAIMTRAQQLASGNAANTTQNWQDYAGAGRTVNSFDAGPLGNQVQSINNIVGHLGLYDQLVSAMNNGDVQKLNSLKQAWETQFGSPMPTNPKVAAALIGPELNKIMQNGSAGGTNEERSAFGKQYASLASSPQQLSGAINTLRQILGRQAGDLAVRYGAATGRHDFAQRYLARDVAQYLDMGDGSAGQGNPGGGMVRVKSPDGRTGSIPAANLQRALAAGYTQVQ